MLQTEGVVILTSVEWKSLTILDLSKVMIIKDKIVFIHLSDGNPKISKTLKDYG